MYKKYIPYVKISKNLLFVAQNTLTKKKKKRKKEMQTRQIGDSRTVMGNG